VRALILAAGMGTRLRPLTITTPKCLVPVHGVALLDHWLALLLGQGISRALVNTHYLADVVARHVDRSVWRNDLEIAHEEGLLGTGGTILKNASFFCGEPFLVAHGDNLSRFDVRAFIARHRLRPSGVEMTMMTFKTDDPRSCGIVEEDERGVVTGFHEKAANPPGNNANAAVYIMEPTVLEFLSSFGTNVIDLSTQVLPLYLGRIATYLNTAYHRDIGTLESLRRAEAEFPASWLATAASPERGMTQQL
jgi:mannose-1-phosphate guanylyltransferase